MKLVRNNLATDWVLRQNQNVRFLFSGSKNGVLIFKVK